MACEAISTGFCEALLSKQSTSSCFAKVCSCVIAAGRYTSALANKTFFFCSLSSFASLADVVVLPEPCKPAMRIMAGGTAAKSKPTLPRPISSVSSSLTTSITAWPGVRLCSTSRPLARAFTFAIKSFTTGRATSASSRAIRTSRIASEILSSVKRA